MGEAVEGSDCWPFSNNYLGTMQEGLRKVTGSSTRTASLLVDILKRRFQNMRKW
jgi:hypothetical protein